MSRRISKTFDFSILTLGQSQVFFAHKKAIDLTTKTKIHLVKKNRFEPDEFEFGGSKDHGEYGYRWVGDIKYKVENYNPNKAISDKDFRAGLFLRMPITNIVYVRPADNNVLKKISENNLNIEIAEE